MWRRGWRDWQTAGAFASRVLRLINPTIICPETAI
jgi:hypothetical protein